MSHILFFSENIDFAEDLKLQVQRLAPDFSFVEKCPDLLVVDENKEKYLQLRAQYPSVPLIFLTSGNEIEKNNMKYR